MFIYSHLNSCFKDTLKAFDNLKKQVKKVCEVMVFDM